MLIMMDDMSGDLRVASAAASVVLAAAALAEVVIAHGLAVVEVDRWIAGRAPAMVEAVGGRLVSAGWLVERGSRWRLAGPPRLRPVEPNAVLSRVGRLGAALAHAPSVEDLVLAGLVEAVGLVLGRGSWPAEVEPSRVRVAEASRVLAVEHPEPAGIVAQARVLVARSATTLR